MALTEADKTFITKTLVTCVSGIRVPLANDRHTALKEFASELQAVMQPLVDEVTALRAEIESLKAGITDAAEQLQKPDADDWWRGSEDEA